MLYRSLIMGRGWGGGGVGCYKREGRESSFTPTKGKKKGGGATTVLVMLKRGRATKFNEVLT